MKELGRENRPVDHPEVSARSVGKKETDIEKIKKEDIKPIVPVDDGSVFVFGINASDRQKRKLGPHSPNFGELDEGAAEATEAQYKDFFDGIFADLSPEERAKLDILVIASAAPLRMPGNVRSPHKRSVETADHILAAAKASMEEHGVNPDQLMNKTGKPIEITSGRLADLKMWEDSPKYVQFLYDRYGDTPQFWKAYEEDWHRDLREEMGAEGPEEIADRVSDYMATLSHAMQMYHVRHPGRKAVVVVNTQYDSAAPMIKKYVLKRPVGEYVPIEKSGGVVIQTDEHGEMSTTIEGKDYPVSFEKLGSQEEALRREQAFLESFFSANPTERMTAEDMLAKLEAEPLDREKVEAVVDRFLERHVRHKNGQIVFVGSGSGKSTTVRNQTPGPDEKTDLVDADFVYRETGAHPLLDTQPGEPLRTFPWWFMGDEVIAKVEARCSLVN